MHFVVGGGGMVAFESLHSGFCIGFSLKIQQGAYNDNGKCVEYDRHSSWFVRIGSCAAGWGKEMRSEEGFHFIM